MSNKDAIMPIGQGSDRARSKDGDEVVISEVTSIQSLGSTLSASPTLGTMGEGFNASLKGVDKPLYMQALRAGLENNNNNSSLSTLLLNGNKQKDMDVETRQELVTQLNKMSLDDIAAEQRLAATAIANPAPDLDQAAESSNNSPSANNMN